MKTSNDNEREKDEEKKNVVYTIGNNENKKEKNVDLTCICTSGVLRIR
jgi:hypothetical protein